MLPTHDTAHVAEGLDHVITQYKGKANLEAILRAGLLRAQDLEDVLWDVLGAELLTRTIPAGAPDQALLQVADLVGAPHGAWSGAQLAFLVRVWILAHKSKGHADDLLTILASAFPNAFTYEEYSPAAYEAWVPSAGDVTLLAPIALALRIARPPAVHGVLAWGTWPTDTFYLGDPYTPALGSGFLDPYGNTNAQGLLGAFEV